VGVAKKDGVSRREFLERSGLAVGAVAAMPALPPGVVNDPVATPKLPHRTLGRTGARVSILAFGCGSRFLMYPEDQASAVLEKAIDSGIDYLDTAEGYGDGESERRVGRVMATRRKDVFLATKVPTRSRTRDAALREVEASLKRLQTDHLDLLHLHSLGDEADLAKIEAPDGALKALYELREQKVTRFIGMTSHTDGAVMARSIERNDLDCVQLAMNPARAARFEELALPAANEKKLGVILMKVTGQDKLLADGGADAASLLRYAWSLPISTAVCGMPKLEFLAANVATAKAYSSPLPPAEMERLRQQLAGRQVVLEQFLAHHHDGGWPA
jgi:predicted aldo/keto reductase-like oxidoreductase